MASRRRHAALVALALSAALAGSACSGDGDDGAQRTPTTAPVATEERTFELASAQFPSMSIEIPERPVATAPAEYEGFSIDVYALHRESRKSVALVFGLRNDSEGSMTFQRELEDPTLEAPVDYAISAVTLFDPVNLKRHLVFLDEQNGCLCSLTATVRSEPGTTLHLAAQFPAPPDDVEQMTVQTPIGTVSNVPLTDG